MATILPADFTFVPKVWEDSVSAYFVRKLIWGSMAVPNNTLMQQPGTSINFPFFTKTGDAQELAVDEAMSVDKLQDDAFNATVKEIGKAIGVRRGALMTSSQGQDRIFSEVQSQIAQVMAEKVDKDLIAEVNTAGNFVQGFNAAANTDVCKINSVLKGLITAFGDRHDEVQALFMHSAHYLTLMTDSTAGFLKADANDPFWNTPGFLGRLLGKALFVVDTVPQGSPVGGKQVFHMFAMKANPYGYITKASPMMEQDYDMLNREYVFGGTQWYAVKAFHAKVSSDDKRIARLSFATELDA